MEELYDRQNLLKLRYIPNAIVVGVGGTGSWVAILLAMSGCPRLHLMDGDNIELTNLNRLPLTRDNLGVPKTEAIERFICSLRPDCDVSTDGRATGLSLALVKSDFDLLFDCTDNSEVQAFLGKWAKDNKKTYIRCGYDGTHLTITNHVSTWGVGGKPQIGYDIVPSWVVPAALAACFAVSKAMYAPDTEIHNDLKEIK